MLTNPVKNITNPILRIYEGVCMKGNIYTNEKCFICKGNLYHDENRNGLFCKQHPEVSAKKHFRVIFGRKTKARFNSYDKAYQFLTGLRFKTIEGTFDYRDYRKDNPLGFCNLAEKWLEFKKKTSKSPNTYRNIKREINKAINEWQDRNIKTVQDTDIEDFLFSIDNISEKTRHNIKSVLHDFFVWACKRANIKKPDFPEIKYVLGWRNIIDIDTQQTIIDEVKNISYHINPKIWLGIKWLSTYVSIRPNEMRSLKERHINVSGLFVIPDDKENDPKLVPMLDEDIEIYKALPRGLPDMYFFRHIKGYGGTRPGSQFGKDYFYKWWKDACKNLGVQGVDLYGGTRHSTVTALGEYFNEDELMRHGTTHKSNKAFRRYMQAKRNESVEIYSKAQAIRGKIIDFKKNKKG
jgi:integrase